MSKSSARRIRKSVKTFLGVSQGNEGRRVELRGRDLQLIRHIPHVPVLLQGSFRRRNSPSSS